MPKLGTERMSLACAELRSTTNADGTRSLSGLIPYNSRSVDLGGFTEEIAPGAFADALQANSDVLCLRDHKQELLLGRTRSKTLALTDSAEGLRWKVTLPKTSHAEDLVQSVERGDLDANSFGFICPSGGDKWTGSRGSSVRTLTKVELLEISPCSFAAYPASTAALRSCPPDLRSGIHLKSEKRYKRVLSAVTGTFWAITESKLQTICDVLSTRAEGGHMSQDEIRAAMMASKTPDAQNSGRVAILGMYGVLTHRATMFSDWSGGSSMTDLQARFRAAMNDDTIDTIVFDVDSPGGDVSGVPEFADEIYAARGKGKTLIAVANAQCGSGAYYLASQCDKLYVTPSGYLGSIGVYRIHEDDSQMLDDLGVKLTLIKSGKFKAEGISFLPLSKAGQEYWQADTDTIYAGFVGAVARGRNVSVDAVTDGFGQGRMVLAATAVAEGMADGVASLDKVLADLGASDPRMQDYSGTLLPAQMKDAGTGCTCSCDACEADDCAGCTVVGCENDGCDCDGSGNADPSDDEDWRQRTLLGLEVRKRFRPAEIAALFHVKPEEIGF